MTPLLPALVGIGAIGYYIYDKQAKPPKGAGAPQVPPILAQVGQSRIMTTPTPKPQPLIVAKTPAGNPVISILSPTAVAGLATNGQAVPQAHALYDYLVENPITSPASPPDMTLAVQAFQKAHDEDTSAVMILGRLVQSGVYDLSTSSALTVYTGKPIAPHSGIPTLASPGSPGNAALTASNLYAYLKTHKNDRSDPDLKELVKAFQKAVNTDSKFPGPAYLVDGKPYPAAVIIKKPLVVDGIYGKNSSDALAAISFERIAP